MLSCPFGWGKKIQIQIAGMFRFGFGPSSDDFYFPLELCSLGCAKPGNSEGIRTRNEARAWLRLCLAEGSRLSLSAELCVKGNQALPAGFTSVDLT